MIDLPIALLLAAFAVMFAVLYATVQARRLHETVTPAKDADSLDSQLLSFIRDFLGVNPETQAVEEFVLTRIEPAVGADAAAYIHVQGERSPIVSGHPGIVLPPDAPTRSLENNIQEMLASNTCILTDFVRTRSLNRSGILVETTWAGHPLETLGRAGQSAGFRSMLCVPAGEGKLLVAYQRKRAFSLSHARAARLIVTLAEAMAAARMRMEERASRNAFNASALVSISQNINSQLSLDRVLTLIVSYAGPMLGADGAFLYLEDSHGLLDLSAGWWREHVFSTDELRAIVEYCHARGAMVNFPDAAIDDAPEVPGVAVPILSYDPASEHPRHLGVLLCLRKSGERRFSKDEADFVQSFADQAAIAVRNADLYQALRSANERLQQLGQLKDEFLQMVSHDIRSPLSAFIGLIDTLLADEKEKRLSPEKREQILTHLIDRAEKTAHAAQESLSVAQIEAGQLVMKPEPVDIAGLLRTLDVQAPSGRELLFKTPQDLPMLQVDPERLRQVMNNLVDNAFKYSPAGGPVDVIVEYDTAPEPFLTITVVDTGIGFTPDEQRYLFKKFGRICTNETAGIPGTGLGLYICRRIVEAAGGRIWGESAGPGRGARFTVALPAPRKG